MAKKKEPSKPMTLYKILYYLSQSMKYTAVGNFWFENFTESIPYMIFHHLVFICIYILFLLETIESYMHSYPHDLHNDAVTFAVAHLIVILRMRIIIYHKLHARQFAHDVIKVCQDYEDDDVLRLQNKKIKNLVIIQYMCVIAAMSGFVIEAIRRMTDGVPFIPVVTYYPTFEDSSYTAFVIRLFILIVQFYFLLNMLSCDNLAISYLIILSYKFMILNKYFDKLRIDYENNRDIMKKDEVAKWFKGRCLKGFNMHRELLRLTKVMNKIFGTVISIQVTESVIVIIQILLRITLSKDLSFIAIAMNLLFILAVYVALALYSLNGGEMTYQASQLSVSIFHCGWHMLEMEEPRHNDVRRLILMGCAQAQRPVVLKAFGVHSLSYETFVFVVRTTYSLFAVLH